MGHENLQEAGESASQAQFAILVFLTEGADLGYVQDGVRAIQLLQHAPHDTLKYTVYNLGSRHKTTQGEVTAVVPQVVPHAQTP
jgi:hypothetical protein